MTSGRPVLADDNIREERQRVFTFRQTHRSLGMLSQRGLRHPQPTFLVDANTDDELFQRQDKSGFQESRA
jgi:hypothetical protein